MPPSRTPARYTAADLLDTDPLRITLLDDDSFLVELGTLCLFTRSETGRAVPRKHLPPSAGLFEEASRHEGVELESHRAARVLRWQETSIGLALSSGAAVDLARSGPLDVVLLGRGLSDEGLDARFAIPGRGRGLDKPMGVALQPGDRVTFSGRGEELYVYSLEPYPGSRRDRWGWLRRIGRD